MHIDSRVLGQAESQEDAVDLELGDDGEDDDAGDGPVRTLTKQQQAELLRRMVDTVGQPGQPGATIQNVISVGMLSEGWDAKTVTHIMGLRAFSSQLLCEQVVGRGLRRTSYDINPETGRFEPEYVNIFGVPFTFLPHEEGTDTPPPPPKPKTLVEPIRERESDFSISWPNILRIEHVYEPRLSIDWDKLPVLTLNPRDSPTHAELAAILEGKPNMESLSEINLQELGRKHRLQTIVFKMARDVFDQMQPGWKGSKEVLLCQLIRIVEEVLRSDRIRCIASLFETNPLWRRILLILNMNRIVQHLWEAIRSGSSTRFDPVFDTHRPILSTSDMRPWYTSRPCEITNHSHINVCVFDGTWEASEAFEIDRSDLVQAWAKNDHLGFEVLYVYRGIVRKYRPDFLIRMTNGTTLVLEVKGQDSDENKAKRKFLDEWVAAVNAHGGFGRWAWEVSFDPGDFLEKLQKHSIAEYSATQSPE